MDWSPQHQLGIAMLKWEKCKILEMHIYIYIYRHLHVYIYIYIYIRRPLPWFPVGYSSGPFPCLPSFSLCTFDTSPIYNAGQSRSSTRQQMLLVCVGLLQARRSNSRALTMVTFVRPFPPVIYSLRR